MFLLERTESATNLKEVTVEFSNENYVTEEAKDEANYTIKDENGNTLSVDSVELDGKKAVLTLVDDEEGSNQLDATLTVDAAVLGTEKDAEKEFAFFDATIPVAEGIELIGPNKFKVTFSEPVVKTVDSEVEVSNGIYGVADITVDGNEAIVTLSASSLEEGDYPVSVSGFEDYAGYEALAKEFTLDYVKDTEAPTATIKKASQTQVVVKFSEPVVDEDGNTLSADYFYHSYSSYTPNETAAGANDAVTVSADGTEYTLNFTENPLPAGPVKFFINHDANSNVVSDEWGNELKADIVLDVNVATDSVKPEVSEVKIVDEQTIRVFFNEDVNQGDAEDKDNFTFKDADGDEVIPSDINYVSNSADEEFYAEALFSADLNGNYTVDVKDVEDKALVPNKIVAVTKAFTVKDLTGPNLDATADTTKVIGVPGNATNPSFIYVYFPEKMATSGEFSVLEAGKYQLNGADLDEDDRVELFKDSSAVKITIADGTTALTNLTIGRVADASGNKSEDLSVTETIAADVSPVISEVSQLDAKTVEIVVDRPLKTVLASGFQVTNDGTTWQDLAAVSWKINSDNETVITGTLKASVQLGANDSELTVDQVRAVAGKNVSETGKSMEAFTFGDVVGEVIEDAFAPHLLTNGVVQTANQEVTLSFSENLALTNAGLAASDLVVTDEEGDTLTAGVDYEVALATDTSQLVVTLIGSSYGDYTGDLEISTKAKVTYITDASSNNNKLKAFTAKEVTLVSDTTSPTVTGVTNGALYDANGATPVFTEGTATLDGNAYSTGTPVTTNGPHVLVVTDASGNSTTVNFTVDANAPTITAVSENGTSTVLTVTFSEAVVEALVEDNANWTFTESDAGTATISSVVYDTTNNTAAITLSAAVTAGDTLLAESTITDAAGNSVAVANDTATRSAGLAGAGTYAIN